jgi:hypothetical protein
MKKIYSIPMFTILALGLVLATGYVVNNFTIKSDVYEPLDVKYYIIGDAGNYDGTTLCSDIPEGDYESIPNDYVMDVDGLFAGESRKFCVLIDNEGEGDIPYTIESKVKTGLGNYNDCVVAFPETTKTGTALGSQVTIDGEVIEVPANAPPVNDCEIEISVARG